MRGRKLPVVTTVLRAYPLLARDWWILLRIVPLPFAVLLALDYRLAGLVQGHWTDAAYTGMEYASDASYNLIILHQTLAFFVGAFIVALWHRVRVGGRQVLSVFGFLSAWRNIASLTLHWSALILIAVGIRWVAGSPLGSSAQEFAKDLLIRKLDLASDPVLYRIAMDLLLGAGPLLVSFYISGRLALMLWARPAGGKEALENAWSAGIGNGWRISAAIFIAILPVMIIDSGLPPFLGAHYETWYEFIRFDISILLQLIFAAGVIAAAHRYLLERKSPDQRALGAAP